MKWVFIFVLSMMCVVGGQELSPVPFEAPSDWREEVISMPPEFAPDMSWSGVEVLKFSPGMFTPTSSDFFSYVFLLKLESGSPDWDEQLLLYYGGLAKAVLKDSKYDVSAFEVSLDGPPQARYGTLQWTEPFVTKRSQQLHLECQQLSSNVWFVCASPQPPDRPIWTSLRTIRNDAARALEL